MPADRAALLALADRVEQAAGPDRELDAEILRVCGHQAVYRGPRMGWECRRNGKGTWSWMPPLTASIDSAMSLVPDGCGLKLERYWRAEPGIWWTAVLSWGAAHVKRVGAEDATSAANAITAAALRARAYMEDANA